MDTIETIKQNNHQTLVKETLDVLKQYQEFSSVYQVEFALGQPTAEGQPRLYAQIKRSDGIPMEKGPDALDQKLVELKDQTIVIRPFFLPMTHVEWKEHDTNEIKTVDFDYGAVIGYGRDSEGNVFLKNLYFLPTDALLTDSRQDADGVWRSIPLAAFNAHRLSLDPRKKFARFLYLAERMSEALEYQYDTYGYFFSTKNS